MHMKEDLNTERDSSKEVKGEERKDINDKMDADGFKCSSCQQTLYKKVCLDTHMETHKDEIIQSFQTTFKVFIRRKLNLD